MANTVFSVDIEKVRKKANIRSGYNQAPHLIQDTNGKVTSQVDITNESQEVSPFPAGDHKALINRRTKANTRQKYTYQIFKNELIHRGSYMSAHVLLNLLNKLGKRDKMRGLPSILSLFRNEFNKFNNTRA